MVTISYLFSFVKRVIFLKRYISKILIFIVTVAFSLSFIIIPVSPSAFAAGFDLSLIKWFTNVLETSQENVNSFIDEIYGPLLFGDVNCVEVSPAQLEKACYNYNMTIKGKAGQYLRNGSNGGQGATSGIKKQGV